MGNLLWTLLKPPVYLVAAIIILLEDWLWEPLHALARLIGRLPVLRRFEAWMATLPPKGALAMFLTPTVILFPFKILALAAFARGMYAVGLGVAIGAKIVGTALVARIFTVCKPVLLTVPWFARTYAWVGMVRERTQAFLRATPVYKAVKALSAAVRRRFAPDPERPGLLGRLWRHTNRRLRGPDA